MRLLRLSDDAVKSIQETLAEQMHERMKILETLSSTEAAQLLQDCSNAYVTKCLPRRSLGQQISIHQKTLRISLA